MAVAAQSLAAGKAAIEAAEEPADIKPDAKAGPPQPRTPYGDLVEGDLHEVMGYQLALATIPTRQMFVAHVGKPMKLRPVEFTLLALVSANTEVTAKRLSQALAISAPALTTVVERLEQRKLIARERSENDRRAQHIRLTDSGARLVRKALDAARQAELEGLRQLTAGERAILTELLAKVGRQRPR